MGETFDSTKYLKSCRVCCFQLEAAKSSNGAVSDVFLVGKISELFIKARKTSYNLDFFPHIMDRLMLLSDSEHRSFFSERTVSGEPVDFNSTMLIDTCMF